MVLVTAFRLFTLEEILSKVDSLRKSNKETERNRRAVSALQAVVCTYMPPSSGNMYVCKPELVLQFH